MKLALLILLALTPGCGAVVTFYPSGKVETAEATFLKHTAVAGYESDGRGHRKIGNVTAQTDDSALSSVVAGAVQGLKMLVGLP